MPGVWDGEHAGAVPGRVALRQPPWLRPSHYEESISVGQECRGEIPLLWGGEPPDVVTRGPGYSATLAAKGSAHSTPTFSRVPPQGRPAPHRTKHRRKEKRQRMQISA